MYSKDFRKLALRLYSQYKNYRKVCSLLRISLSTLHRWKTLGIEHKNRRQRKYPDFIFTQIEALVANNPFITIKDVHQVLRTQSIKRCYKTLCRYFKRRNITRKKAYHCCLDGIDSEKEHMFMQAMHDSTNCIKVSIDECYFSEKVLPHYGYAKRGQRVTTSLLPKSWKKRSLILAVGSDGSLTYEIYYGSINSKLFQEFVASLNMPENVKLMLDNVRFHHSIDTSNCIFTPPYQPKYNPVE